MNRSLSLILLVLLSGCFDKWLPTCLGNSARVDLVCTNQDGSQKPITCALIGKANDPIVWDCQSSGTEKSCTGQKALQNGTDWYEAQSYINWDNPASQFQFSNHPPMKVEWVDRNVPVSGESDCDKGDSTYYPVLTW